MSLFIGNLPRDANERDLEELFDKIGSCTFRFKVPPIYNKLTMLFRVTTPS
jgi:RNA recognition motif-containing protein